jgi:hypothetical protein
MAESSAKICAIKQIRGGCMVDSHSRIKREGPHLALDDFKAAAALLRHHMRRNPYRFKNCLKIHGL